MALFLFFFFFILRSKSSVICSQFTPTVCTVAEGTIFFFFFFPLTAVPPDRTTLVRQKQVPPGRTALHFNRFTRFRIPRNPIKSQSRLFDPVICVGFKPPSGPAVFSHQQHPPKPRHSAAGPPRSADPRSNRAICSPNAVAETGWTVSWVLVRQRG